ncbi:MAG: hypothetical protein AAB545_00905 [Patescibacteria group bacterium]
MKFQKLLFLLLLALLPGVLYAEEFTSGSYKVKDPVLNPGEYLTSSTYTLWSSIGEVAIGTSSATSYGINAGFLFFPLATAPSLSATAGASSVSLSWTASSGFLGWTVSSYTTGYSTASGGPYTYTNVGNVLLATQSGLTNGTLYYFVVVSNDFFGNALATSSEAFATPTGSGSGSGGSGGGGGGIVYVPPLNEEVKECKEIADLNCDGYVDIIDFSIMIYWFDKTPVPKRVDLKPDRKIDIHDFSVMAYYWRERTRIE